MIIQACKYHDFSYGHRVEGHEGKCRWLHGHNGRVHFYCESEVLDKVGRVIDFSCIGERLCLWVEENWDHKFLVWKEDPLLPSLEKCVGLLPDGAESIVPVPFNPTAENLSSYLLKVVGPKQLEGTNVVLKKVKFEETRKCSATSQLGGGGI